MALTASQALGLLRCRPRADKTRHHQSEAPALRSSSVKGMTTNACSLEPLSLAEAPLRVTCTGVSGSAVRAGFPGWGLSCRCRSCSRCFASWPVLAPCWSYEEGGHRLHPPTPQWWDLSVQMGLMSTSVRFASGTPPARVGQGLSSLPRSHHRGPRRPFAPRA